MIPLLLSLPVILMLNFKTFATLGLTAAALAIAPNAEAFTRYGSLTAQEFEDRNVEVVLSPESRWGDGGVSARTHEVNIHRSDFSTADQSNYRWENGEAVNFSVVFDGINTLTYTIGDTVLQTTEVEDNFSDLYLRTSAYRAGSSMTLTNMTFSNGGTTEAIDDVASVCDSGCGFFDASYYHIGDIVGAFSLTGQSMMSWDEEGPLPTNSRLAYQVKLVYGDGDIVSTPEPGSMLGLAGLALGAITAGKGKKKDA